MAKSKKTQNKNQNSTGAAKQQPPLGFSTDVELVRVIDGDTIVVEFKRQFAIRLTHDNDKNLEFNSPEKDTQAGLDAKKFLEDSLAGKKLSIFIPAHNSISFLDIQSFNRVLAELWADGELVTQKMLDNKMADLLKKGTY